MKSFLITISLFLSISALAVDSLSYSGRLVNSNGSSAVGPVKLKFDLFYSNDTTEILCSDEKNGVDLVNGVFHVKLDFNCGATTTFEKILAETPDANTIVIRVTDITNSSHKIYPLQAVHSTPYAILSNMAKSLAPLDATIAGQILTWNGTKWTAGDPIVTTNGTLTSLTVGDGLYGGTITETGIIGLSDGGVTAQKLHQMGATSGQVLKWNGTSWAPAADSDTGVANEADPNVLAFARNDVTGITPEICNNNQTLRFISVDKSLRCFDVVKDVIVASEDKIAPSQKAVAEALNLKQDEINPSTDLVLKSLTLTNADSSWITLQASSASANFPLTLPSGPGLNGQVLRTDGSGKLSWFSPTTNSSTIVDGSIVNDDISAGANISQSKIEGLTTSFTTIQDSITNLTTTNVAEGTNKYFTEPKVLGTKITGLNTTNGLINDQDTVLSSIGKLIGNLGLVSTAQSNYVLKDGTSIMSGPLQMGGFKVTNLASPGVASDAANKQYVDEQTALSASKWSKVGTTINYDDGFVGIGTDSPTRALDVRGNVQFGVNSLTSSNIVFSPSTSAQGSIRFTSDPGANYIQSGVDDSVNSTKDLRFGPIGTSSHSMVIKGGTGNVGIGLSHPTAKLAIRQTGATIRLESETENNDSSGMIVFGENSTDSNFTIRYDGAGTRPGSGVLTFNGMGYGDIMTLTRSGSVGIGTDMPGNKLDVAGNVGINGRLRLKSDNSNYVEIKSPIGLVNTIDFTLPGVRGSNGQFLKTDALGNLSWADVTTGTITGITTTAPLSGSGTSGSVNLSVSYDNSTIALNGSNALSVNSGSIMNTHIGAAASIDWSKINKTGALASDVGAVPIARTVTSGTGLLGGGDLSTNRTLTVDVGTNAGQIVQVQTGNKLPALDGSQLTNLGTNLGKWSDATGGIHYSSGNVGIGTTTPSVPLEVKSNAGAGLNNIFKITSSDGDAYFSIFDNASSSSVFAPAYLGYAGMTEQAALQFVGGVDAANDVAGAPLITFQGRRGSTTGSAIVNRDIVSFNNYATSLMKIKANGNVGIGASAPVSLLEIAKTGVASGVESSVLTLRSENSGQGAGSTIDFWNGNATFTSGAGYTSSIAGIDDGTYNGRIEFRTNSSGTIARSARLTSADTKMVIKANGNVGIGSSDPKYPLQVDGLTFVGGSKSNLDPVVGHTFTPLKNSGKMLIGWNRTAGNGEADFISNRGTTGSQGGFKFWDYSNTDVLTELMYIRGDGFLDVQGNIRTAGCLYYNASSIGTCLSDERLKEGIRPFELGLNELLGINPVYFKYNGLGGIPIDSEQLGVIAQEVEKVAPALVVKTKIKLHPEDKTKTEVKAVDYGAFTYVIINSIKELSSKIEGLFDFKEEFSREIASVKAENEEIKAENKELKNYICKKDSSAPFCKK